LSQSLSRIRLNVSCTKTLGLSGKRGTNTVNYCNVLKYQVLPAARRVTSSPMLRRKHAGFRLPIIKCRSSHDLSPVLVLCVAKCWLTPKRDLQQEYCQSIHCPWPSLNQGLTSRSPCTFRCCNTSRPNKQLVFTNFSTLGDRGHELKSICVLLVLIQSS